MIPVSKPSIGYAEQTMVGDALASGWVSSAGPYVERFEHEFAAFCGTNYALATSSGTAALHLALLARGIGPGDEVIVPDLTFVATANAAHYTGAKVVVADVDPDTLCLTRETVEPHLTKQTKAIIPVHLFGHPADMAPLLELCWAENIALIEDAAQAHGAIYRGQRAGSIGTAGCFSFYGNKIISTGEGGMLTTDDRGLYERAFHLRGHAQTTPYFHDRVGYNYRMTNIQAALGCAQLSRIEEFLGHRKWLRHWYTDQLLPTIYEAHDVTSAFWMMWVYAGSGGRREELMASLLAADIQCRAFFRPLSTLPMYKRSSVPVNPIARHAAESGLCLPTFFGMTEAHVREVSTIVYRFLRASEERIPKPLKPRAAVGL